MKIETISAVDKIASIIFIIAIILGVLVGNSCLEEKEKNDR